MREGPPPDRGDAAAESPGRAVPGAGRLVGRALRLACPLCGHRPIFRRWFRMDERCGRCDLVFERIVGHWFGSLTLNTIFCFGLLLVVILGSFLRSWPDTPDTTVLAIGVAAALLSPIVLFPWSRTLWLALDLRLRPLEPDEAPGFGPAAIHGDRKPRPPAEAPGTPVTAPTGHGPHNNR